MSDPIRFMIELPPTVSADVRERLLTEVQEVQGVSQAGDASERSLDPSSIRMWVELAGTIITTTGVAVPVMQKVFDLFHKREIRGVKVTLGVGTVIDADRIAAEELKKLVAKSEA